MSRWDKNNEAAEHRNRIPEIERGNEPPNNIQVENRDEKQAVHQPKVGIEVCSKLTSKAKVGKKQRTGKTSA